MVINVIPLLKSAEWAEVAAGQELLCSTLPVGSAAASTASPVIAYGINQAESVAFLPASESNKQKLPEIHVAALASLRSRLCDLDWGWIDGRDGRGDILAFADDFNAAECLLLPERMLEAHTLLDSPRLLACTPKRGVLLVGRYALGGCAEHSEIPAPAANSENRGQGPRALGEQQGATESRAICVSGALAHQTADAAFAQPGDAPHLRRLCEGQGAG